MHNIIGNAFYLGKRGGIGYLINNKIYFGEMTFSHEDGFAEFIPKKFGKQLGALLKLTGSIHEA